MSLPSINEQVVCIGAVLIDELFYCFDPVIASSSNPAVMKKTAGGVMRNIAHHLVALDISTAFITVAGNDVDGEWLINNCKEAGIDMSAASRADCSTGKYAAILNPDGSLYAAAAVNPCEAYLNIELLQQQTATLLSASIVIADTNSSTEVLSWLIAFCNKENKLLFIEPVSVSKAKKLSSINLNGVFMITPNEDELRSLLLQPTTTENAVKKLLQQGVKNVWLRSGVNGSAIYSNSKTIELAAPVVAVKDSTGAGDAALAAWVAARCFEMNEIDCLKAAHAMAAEVLKTDGAMAINMNKLKLLQAVKAYYPHEI